MGAATLTSIRRLTANDGALLIVDLQERLLGAMTDRARIVWNAVRLTRGAQLLKIPASATEQYPKGLGPTVSELAGLIGERRSKSSFQCCEAEGFLSSLEQNQTKHVTLAGIEAHVCVAQTAIELIGLGYIVQVAADAVTSRNPLDLEFAFRRLERAGAVVSTTEAILFEWTERSDRPEFKAISQLIKSTEDRSNEGLSS